MDLREQIAKAIHAVHCNGDNGCIRPEHVLDHPELAHWCDFLPDAAAALAVVEKWLREQGGSGPFFAEELAAMRKGSGK